MLLTIILPFLKHKWGPLLKLTREIETAAEATEHVTEMVEKVAEEVEKVTEEVVDELPEGGKLKKAVAFVENVAKETAKDAHLAQDIIEKVEETAKEMDSFLEPADANGISKEASDEK
ncbi:uncharacterized protein LOC131162099 [Malania oleifera]|uniref:uncharacterized protein LOC131162099 n=1 Tax=Malania oleifera TaxID=397392 RepID=UPI0025ADFC79|nr:uncharacterized protein LOC131162099 [Malania oleifera]